MEERTGLIYCVTNKITEKMYIGLTRHTLAFRKKQHINSMKAGAPYVLCNAIRKHGIDNFSWAILESTIPISKLANIEMVYIDLFDTYNTGYNSTHGGDGVFGMEFTEASKIKMSLSHIGKRLPEAQKILIGESSQRRIKQYTLSGNFIREWDSLKEAGETLDINRSSISDVCRGTRKKSAGGFIWRYEDNDFPIVKYNNPASPIIVRQYTKEGSIISQYKSITEASIKTGVAKTTIVRVCKGRQHTAGGFKWKYADK